MKILIRRIGIGLSAIFFAIAAQISIVTPTYALECDVEFFEANDIPFWNPCEGYDQCSDTVGDLTAPAPTSLTGESNPEKVWNYFIARGLTPVAAAGAMGNMEQESSGFDPWAGEGGDTTIDKGKLGVGFGLIQWTNTENNTQGRRYGVMNYLETNGVPLVVTDDQTIIDQALLLELNWLWDQEQGGMKWQEQLNAETTVDGDPSKPFGEDNTGNGSAMLFHALVERSGDDTEGKQQRIDGAKKFLETFGQGGAGECGIGEGGLTADEAQKIMTYYRDVENRDSITSLFTQAGRGDASFFLNGNDPDNDPRCGAPDADMSGIDRDDDLMSRLSNCTAFSTYFIAKYTDMNFNANGNGRDKVTELLAINPEATTGSEPKVFAIFSRQSGDFGHTGVILGIDGDKVIIGEAACGSGLAGIVVRESTISEMSGDNYKYMYTDGHINQQAILDVVNG